MTIEQLQEMVRRDTERAKERFTLAMSARIRHAEECYFLALQCLTRAKGERHVGRLASLIMQARAAVKLGIEEERRVIAESRKGAL